jgi:subtilisin inhibitor-like
MGRECKDAVSGICLATLIASCLALISGCGLSGDSSDEGSGETSAGTELTITVWPQGMGGPMREWTLTCDPAGGTLPDAASACARLTAELLEPLPPDTICTQIYGGPQVARVQGTFEGSAVDSQFKRVNGCEIERWNSASFLFPVRI